MKIGLIDVDSHNFPNLCLMKLSAYHKAKGHTVEWWNAKGRYDLVYKSRVFTDTYSKDTITVTNAEQVIFGGTGYDTKNRLPPEVEHSYPDYSIYPQFFGIAYGFLSRGCPRNCGFCIVSGKEGRKSVNLNYSEGDTPIALKSDFILSFCELIMGGKNGLEAVEKTLIDRAVISVYRNYLADPKPENMPILGDLYDEIKKQPEKEAQRIAAALELYVNGSLNIFNHRTNVDIHNRLVCFDIKELGTQLKKVGMLIVQDQVWNRVTVNRSEGKATRYYIDEFHLLLKEEQTAAYSVEIWKRFRKWGGIPTGITQNVKDLLSSREVENIFENSDFVYMLNQAQGDREILAKQLNISQQQMTYVTHSEAGEGLIFYGNVILPFIDRFPKDTELYRVMTTKPGEVSA